MTGHGDRPPPPRFLEANSGGMDGHTPGSRLASLTPEVTRCFCLARPALPRTRAAGRAASALRGKARGGSLARHSALDFEPGLCTFLGRAATLSLEEAADGSGMYQSHGPLPTDGGVGGENPHSQVLLPTSSQQGASPMQTQGLSPLKRRPPAPAPRSGHCCSSRSAPCVGSGAGSRMRIGSSPTGGLAGFL